VTAGLAAPGAPGLPGAPGALGEPGGDAPGEALPAEEVDHWLASGPRGSVFLAAS
jgi:hypothetical protein